jgi:hypothetical protein
VRTRWRSTLFTLASVGSLVYVAVVHHGLGAPPGGMAREWWQPTGFLRDWYWIGRWVDAPLIGIALLTAPVAALLALLYTRPAPALARATVAVATASVAILSFYGLQPTAYAVWSFFHWRGSVVMLASGLLLGCTLAAPDLARALRRQHPIVQVVLYGFTFFAVSSLIRNATGWDPSLSFNISPWPAIPVLALQIGAYTWVGAMTGMAIATASVAFARTPARRALGVVVGIAWPVAWFAFGFPHTEPELLLIGAVVSAGIVAIAVSASSGGRAALAERAASLGLGAALVALPLLTGRALADGDFAVSKHLRARMVIDALAAYYEDEATYPETLDELVELDLLERVPTPRVGSELWRSIGLTEQHEFDYRNLGSSYVLEFVATEWVMCSYNPPWEDDFDAGEDEDIDEFDAEADYAECLEVCHASCDDETEDCDAFCTNACEAERSEQAAAEAADLADEGGESWSCPDSRPELW